MKIPCSESSCLAGAGNYKVSELLDSVKGRLVQEGVADFYGISLDSRGPQENRAFFCLKGQNADGHDFAGQAVENGACVLVVGRGRSIPAVCRDVSVVEVEDPSEAMRSFAAFCRKKLDCPVIGVTGSNGKTTTKEMIASIMACAAGGPDRVLKNGGNRNTDFGMALSLSTALSTHKYCVLEMAMRGFGQIKRLAEIALPNIGVITNIGPAHIEFLGSVDNIAKAKAELFQMLPRDGVAVYPDDELQRLGKTAAHIPPENHWTFGYSLNARVRIVKVLRFAFGSRIVLRSAGRDIEIEIPVPGEHNVKNAACAVAVSLSLNIAEDNIIEGLAALSLPGQRSDVFSLNGRWIMDDCYNANPVSMKAALETVVFAAGKRRSFAVLGDMLELGQESERHHLEIGRYAASLGIHGLICVGEQAHLMAKGAKEAGCPSICECENLEDAAGVVWRWMDDGDWVLFKGSRSIHLEKAVQALRNISVV